VIGMKNFQVGQFFEDVGHALIGGELTRHEDGDIVLWDASATIEVKASGLQSSYGYRLDIDQIDRYGELSAFPFDRAWYMFFAYNNPSVRNEKGGRSSALSRHSDRVEVNRYLARAVSWFVLLDHSIVAQWRALRRVSTKSVMGHLGTKTVDVRCREVHSLANGGFATGLTELDLDPAQFAVMDSKVDIVVDTDLFEKYRMRFPITVVTPVKEIKHIKKALRVHSGIELLSRS